MTRGSAVRERSIALALGVCFVLATPCSAAGDQEALDRLFFTPERRQQLDRQREMNTLDSQQVPAEPMITVDGIVTRSSGRRTAWINGSPQHEADTGSRVIVRTARGHPGKVVVHTDSAPAAKARVGETVNSSTGQAQDLLNGGTLSVHRRPAVAK
jgi:hypothetical protein